MSQMSIQGLDFDCGDGDFGCGRGGGGGAKAKAKFVEHQSKYFKSIATPAGSGENDMITLILGPQTERVLTHKVVLVSGSPVLGAMVEESPKELVIRNVCPRLFRLLLQFLYTGDPGANMEDAIPLFKMATFYKIPILREKMLKILHKLQQLN